MDGMSDPDTDLTTPVKTDTNPKQATISWEIPDFANLLLPFWRS